MISVHACHKSSRPSSVGFECKTFWAVNKSDPFPNLDHKSAHLQENFEQGLEWDGTEVYESDVVKNLVQLGGKKSIPEGGWVCEYDGCAIKQNLWLNLSDGFVACGRQSHGSVDF
jgi:hypothetical protein